MSLRVVIVGAGMAAAYLLQALAAHRHELAITVIGDEPDACYNRVLLSGLLAGEHCEADLAMLTGVEPDRPVRYLTGTRVIAIDPASRSLHTDRGETLHWDHLVLATGARVALPPLADTDLSGVATVRTLEDVRRLQSLVGEGGAAVVVGGGLLGLEAAHGLNSLGFDTTVLHRRAWLMNRQLDEEGAGQLQRNLECSGLRFRLQAGITALRTTRGRLTGVALDDGGELPCTLVVFATGIEPNATLAAGAGLRTDRGVLVDEYLRTSADNVHALGECSQFGEHCFGLVAPIREQAAVLARRLAGIDGPGFALREDPTQLKISGIEIFSAGVLDPAAEQLLLRDSSAGTYRRLVLRDGRLVGAVLVGDKRHGSWYAQLIREGSDVSALRPGLMFGRDVCESLSAAARAA